MWESLGGVFTSAPHAVTWGEQDEHLFVFAVGTDQALWYRQGDGNAWSGWASLGGVVTSRPYAVKSGDVSIDVFALGVYSDLLHWHFENNAWTRWPLVETTQGGVYRSYESARRVVDVGPYRNWESLGGILISPPCAVMFGAAPAQSLLVFALGLDHAVWSKQFRAGSWSEWESLGHMLSSAPHAVTWQQETFAVFALGTDHAVWYSMGGAWHSLGGDFSSPPYAISAPQHLHVFAADAHSVLQHCRWDGNAWSSWEALQGILMSPPTALCLSAISFDFLLVFAVGTDSALWLREWDGSQWTAWVGRGGVVTSPLHAVHFRPIGRQGEFDVVALGTDHTVQRLSLPE